MTRDCLNNRHEDCGEPSGCGCLCHYLESWRVYRHDMQIGMPTFPADPPLGQFLAAQTDSVQRRLVQMLDIGMEPWNPPQRTLAQRVRRRLAKLLQQLCFQLDPEVWP